MKSLKCSLYKPAQSTKIPNIKLDSSGLNPFFNGKYRIIPMQSPRQLSIADALAEKNFAWMPVFSIQMR